MKGLVRTGTDRLKLCGVEVEVGTSQRGVAMVLILALTTDVDQRHSLVMELIG